MFVVSNFVLALANVVSIILTLFYWMFLIRALISWVNPDPFNPIVQFLHRMTEPILQPIRRFLPFGPMDFSPIIAFIAIIFLQGFLVASLKDLGYSMRQSEKNKNIMFESFQERNQQTDSPSYIGK